MAVLSLVRFFFLYIPSLGYCQGPSLEIGTAIKEASSVNAVNYRPFEYSFSHTTFLGTQLAPPKKNRDVDRPWLQADSPTFKHKNRRKCSRWGLTRH